MTPKLELGKGLYTPSMEIKQNRLETRVWENFPHSSDARAKNYDSQLTSLVMALMLVFARCMTIDVLFSRLRN
jgi:hypothetical protein